MQLIVPLQWKSRQQIAQLQGPLTAEFAQDGTFTISNEERSSSVTGSYSLDDGLLVLSEGTGDVGSTAFPIRCGIERQDAGFRLTSPDGGCRPLAGTKFVAATQSQ